MKDADGIPWEMYALLEDADVETAADVNLRSFLGQATDPAREIAPDAGPAPDCCAPSATPRA